MIKLKINERQYKTILNHGKETRLNDVSEDLTVFISEDKELIEEGFKEFILGAALVLSQAVGGKMLAQSGHNKEIANKAVENKEIMAQIKSTLEDEQKTKELSDSLVKLGISNPEELLAKNADRVVNAFNRLSNDKKMTYRLDTKAVDNLKSLSKELKKGYALKDKEVSTDTIKKEVQITTNVKDTIDVEFGSDKFFVTGGYELSQSGVDSIKEIINAIIKQGGEILSINVESSTDAERIVKYINDYDETGNIELAKLRSKSVTDLVSTLAGDSRITHREIPNNGSDIVSTEEFLSVANDKGATAALREKTSEFRYVKMTITAVFTDTKPAPSEPTSEIIKTYRFELVKVITNSKGTPPKYEFPNKKFKCKKNPPLGRLIVNDCGTF